MAKVQHLSNAPIREALIDIKVELPEGATPEILSNATKKLGNNFSEKSVQRGFSLDLQAGGGGSRVTDPEISGYAFEDKNSHQIVQFRMNGFTFSLIDHYENWGDLLKRAKPLWSIYHEATNPVKAFRIAVRFINQLTIYSPLDKYLILIPSGTDNLLGNYISSLIRVTKMDPPDTSIILTQAIKPQLSSGGIPVVLDIDVFQEKTFGPGDESMWDTIQSFRNIKNDYFFGSLHELALEPYR